MYMASLDSTVLPAVSSACRQHTVTLAQPFASLTVAADSFRYHLWPAALACARRLMCSSLSAFPSHC